MQDPLFSLTDGYPEFIKSLKERIGQAQTRAAMSVNQELVLLYWEIGSELCNRQGWGTNVIGRIAKDLIATFPGMKGFSPRNIAYMRNLAEAWPDKEILLQVIAKLPWGHNITLLDKLQTQEERLWYAKQTIENGWSRNTLVHQIESNLRRRLGAADTNFSRTLPAPQSELVQQIIKDPYNFDFLTISKNAQERDIERALLSHIQKFLLELGVGFAFLGSQYHLIISNKDYYLDLLFYHLKLHCYVVIELKATEFEPEFAGKMNFYLTAVDRQVKQPGDQPSIGIILCKSKDKLIVEYALADVNKPIGVSEYQLTEVLPETLKGSLPTFEQLEVELSGEEESLED